MGTHIPNPKTYRPLLGEETNKALFQLVQHKNSSALTPLRVNDYLRKMIEHWWKNEFPGTPFSVETKRYDEDFELYNTLKS